MTINTRSNFVVSINHILCCLSILIFLDSCASFKVVPNGYLVRGDDNFVSIDEQLVVLLGPSFLTDQAWSKASPPLKVGKLSSKHTRLLKRLGYKPRSHAAIFTSNASLPFVLISVVNTSPINSLEKETWFNIGKHSRKITKNGDWFYKKKEIDGKTLYNAFIPVAKKLNSGKYLSLIYISPIQRDLNHFEEVVEKNAALYRNTQYYFPMMSTSNCPEDVVKCYYDYVVPKRITQRKGYTLLKVFPKNDKTKLVYYSLLNPAQTLGSFKLCQGEYTIEYTDLDGKALWTEDKVLTCSPDQ